VTGLLAEVLSCYKPHCRYLTDLTVDGRLATGAFAIPESCYIDDTGHLNAVEANISYNQLLYATIATMVAERSEPAFATWTMAELWRRRLSDVLIARIASEFRRPIEPGSFHGELAVDRLITLHGCVSVDTTFRFWDQHGGAASGSARVAIVDGEDIAPLVP
jgi:hypothetical protein